MNQSTFPVFRELPNLLRCRVYRASARISKIARLNSARILRNAWKIWTSTSLQFRMFVMTRGSCFFHLKIFVRSLAPLLKIPAQKKSGFLFRIKLMRRNVQFPWRKKILRLNTAMNKNVRFYSIENYFKIEIRKAIVLKVVHNVGRM